MVTSQPEPPDGPARRRHSRVVFDTAPTARNLHAVRADGANPAPAVPESPPGLAPGTRIKAAVPGRAIETGTVTEALTDTGGAVRSYAWRPDRAADLDHPWHANPGHVLVSPAHVVRPLFTGPHTPGPDVGRPDLHRTAVQRAGNGPVSEPTVSGASRTVTRSPRPGLDTGRPAPLRLEEHGDIIRVLDPVHGRLDVPADQLSAALRWTRPELCDLLSRYGPGRPLAPDLPRITLAALAALAAPAAWPGAATPTEQTPIPATTPVIPPPAT
ncbi:hypothetical protein [Frankia sp. CiP3]|uniref:hypothetical protein n=1 Tax=Frankia sp. CiP3 TaxID=2880971 RepID=UPI001EF6A80B|nr:hypothetical protein [Frankia sp. CiP3]